MQLTRIKTGYLHTGFLDRDAVEALQGCPDWRREKTGEEMGPGMPIFVSSRGDPVRAKWISMQFSMLARRAGVQRVLVDRQLDRRYKITAHEMRDLLKSTLIDCGCRADVADHVIGHMPRDSYEKQAVPREPAQRVRQGLKKDQRLHQVLKEHARGRRRRGGPHRAAGQDRRHRAAQEEEDGRRGRALPQRKVHEAGGSEL